MVLYLVQHGKSLPKETDPDQGLSQEGIADVRRIAEVAKNYRVEVAEIWHSGKKRAFQTAELFASVLNPKNGVRQMSGLNPLDDVAAFTKTVDGKTQLMLAGHMPFMSRLTSYLILGVPDKPVFKFQNGGIVCLEQEPDSGSWIIRWTLMPHIR